MRAPDPDLQDHPSDEPLELISKPRKLIRSAIAASAVIVITFVVLGVMLKRFEAGTGATFTVADQVGIAGVGLILGGGSLIFARPRVWANRERVVVRNLLFTKSLPWGVVRDIGVSTGATWGMLDLQDDDQLSMLGLQLGDGQPAIDAIRRLRELHAQAHGLTTHDDADGADESADDEEAP